MNSSTTQEQVIYHVMSTTSLSWVVMLLVLCCDRGDTLQLPYPKSKVGPCPSSCEGGECTEIAVTGLFYVKDVLGDCSYTCDSYKWGSKGFGQCWGTGVSRTDGCIGLKNVQCQCQKLVTTTDCIKEGKVVDGQWASWSKWAACSKACDGGVRSRWRLCNNPTPQYGGKVCLGLAREEGDCSTQSCSPCRSDVQSDCPSWIPQYNTAGEGFDIMTFKPMITNIIEMKQFGRCEKHSETNQCLRIPSSVQEWKYRPMCYQDITDETYTSVKELDKMQEDFVSESWKVGLDGKVELPIDVGVFGSFSAEASFAGSNSDFSAWSRRQAESSKTQYQNIELNCQLYEFTLTPSKLPLTSAFSNSLKLLPANLSITSMRDYSQFMHDFGSHYFDKIVLGGRIKSITAILQSDLEEYTMTASDVKDCLSMEAKARLGFSAIDLIDISLGASGEYNKCTRKSSSSNQYLYTSNFISKRNVLIRGGSLDTQKDLLFSSATQINYQRWLADIKYNPGVYKYSTLPLYRLLRKLDQEQQSGQRPRVFHNLTKKAENLRKVTIKYIRGKMDEIDCDILDEKPKWCISSATSQCMNIGLLVVACFSYMLLTK
uniref:Toxin candidate TRINITY_DN25980_c0_g1_i1.p1 n=1 Tax=Pachycerianthus borealis TaxID=2736680 RepID=A0A7G7WYU2_9CNID|nr:toxin candidate TRINITY_DN25980_c0_g1_i1.p1 [Pachycerianthus borealis]